MSRLTHVSLFSGVGMFDHAFHLAGIPTIAACEIDTAARGVIKDHFPDIHIFTDVREVTADALRDLGADPRRTVLSAGWPCQDASVAGSRLGFDGERTSLWREVARILGEFSPAWFLGENVPGLLSVNAGRDFAEVVTDLGNLGYGYSWRVLDARHFGVPQRRRRLAIVGHRGNVRGPVEVLLEPESVRGNPAAGITPRPVTSRGTGGGAAVCGVTGDTAHTLTAEGADASEDGTGRGTPVIVAPEAAATLTAGSNRPGISAPGRRQEDDHNLVACVPSSLAATRYDWTYGEHTEARPGEVLRLLRETAGEEEVAEWLTGVVASLLPPEVLRPPVHGEGLRPSAGDHRSVVDDGTPPRPEDGPSRPVRDLREAGRERCAPPQWQLAGQLARELDEALSQLPPEGTSRRDALLGLWRAAQGAGLLRQALPEVQDDRGPAGDAHARAEDVQRLWGTSALTVTLWEALHAGEAGGHSPDDLTGGAGVTTVRRLTPLLLECERLQGLPDGWTATSDGKPQSDSRRYHQIGNGIAVPVFEWIARRIATYDKEDAA